MSHDEAMALTAKMTELVDPYLERPDRAGRDRILFNTVLIPDVSIEG